jgi:CheY-like chemotaxis protein
MRIAYVEDNPTNFSLVERVARMAQHTVVSYTEGEIALSALKTEVYDLILMDVELAGEMNGLDLVRLLRKHGLQTPIVAVTAYAMLGDREKCIEAGCNEYLPKPLPISELVNTFAKYAELAKNAAKLESIAVEPVQEPIMLVAPNPEATAVLLERQEPTVPAMPPSVPTPALPSVPPVAPPTVPPAEPPSVPPVTPPSVPTPTPPSVPPVAPPTVPPAEPPSVPKPTRATAPLTPLPKPPSEAKPLPTSPRGNTKPITLKPDNVVDNKS